MRYFRLMLNFKDDIPVKDVISVISTLEDPGGNGPDPGSLLAVSDIYLKSGFADSAMVYIDRYREANPDYGSSSTYYLRLSNIYDTLGLDRKALEAYRKHVTLKDSTYMDKISENVQLVAAMYDSYVQMSRSERIKRILWLSLGATVVLGAAVTIHFRRKIWKQSRRGHF